MKNPVSVALIKTQATAAELGAWLAKSEKDFAVDFVLAWVDPMDEMPRYAVNLDQVEWDGLSAWRLGWSKVLQRLHEGASSGHLAPIEPTRWTGAL
jgi:hypothetical protein